MLLRIRKGQVAHKDFKLNEDYDGAREINNPDNIHPF